jgi:hypothetical protein
MAVAVSSTFGTSVLSSSVGTSGLPPGLTSRFSAPEGSLYKVSIGSRFEDMESEHTCQAWAYGACGLAPQTWLLWTTGKLGEIKVAVGSSLSRLERAGNLAVEKGCGIRQPP